MKNNFIKRGFQSPKEYRANEFHHINIDGLLHYCPSHHFVFDTEKEEEKLYNAQPCMYTDGRYSDGRYNFFHQTQLYFARAHKVKLHDNKWCKVNRNPKKRKKPISLKSCLRRMRKLKGLPKGTLVKFYPDWSYTGIDQNYVYIENRENNFQPEYEINYNSFSKNFLNDNHSVELVNLLRSEGFIVSVYNCNPGFIYSEEEGEYAVAYGYGKKIGFSSNKNSFRGYSNGIDNILYDFYGEFDKWSRCVEIKKDTPIETIIKILKETVSEDILLCGTGK